MVVFVRGMAGQRCCQELMGWEIIRFVLNYSLHNYE